MIAFEPLKNFLGAILNDLLVILCELFLHLFLLKLVLHLEAVVLKPILLLDLGFDLLIFSLVELTILDHFVNFFLTEAVAVIDNCNLL